jgi:ERCC4-type nuclease
MTVRRLNELYALYQKPFSLVGNTKGFADDRVLSFPTGCRGKTGQKVLDYFGSLTKVATAEIDELLAVDDIGAKRAKGIYIHFHRKGIGKQV